MGMKGFTLLWAKMLDSSVWRNESKETRLVWVTLMMMRNSEGIIESSLIGLADRAKVTKAECVEALRVFLSPDPEDTSKVEEGRRIREVPGGWQIVNHDLYRFSTEAKREFWKQQKQEQREKKKAREAMATTSNIPMSDIQRLATAEDQIKKAKYMHADGQYPTYEAALQAARDFSARETAALSEPTEPVNPMY